MKIEFTLNGRLVAVDVDPLESVRSLLRSELGLLSPKVACRTADCGACTIMMDGRTYLSCSLSAYQLQGRQLETLEGLYDEQHKLLHPVQEALLKAGAVGCGYCLSGVVLSMVELLSRESDPDDAEIRERLGGVTCRCGLYEKFVQAIRGLRTPLVEGKGKAARRL